MKLVIGLMRKAGCLFGGLIVACLLSALADKFTKTDCLNCHLDPTTTRKVGDKVVPPIFPTNDFNKSVLVKLHRINCHEGIKDLVHESKLPSPNCTSCHTVLAQGAGADLDKLNPQCSAFIHIDAEYENFDCHSCHTGRSRKNDMCGGLLTSPRQVRRPPKFS